MRLSQTIRKAVFPVRRRLRGWLRPPLRDGGPPAGIFQETEEIRATRVCGEILENRPEVPLVPADSEIRAAGLGQHSHSEWPVVWSRRDRAFLAAPSLVHANDTDHISLEAAYGIQSWNDPTWGRTGRLPLRELKGDFTSLVSRWNDGSNYYHWFMDGLTRLAHLEHFPADCRILVPRDLPPFARRSMELLGLSERMVETSGEDLVVERYWFAGPTMLSGCPDPLGIPWLRQRFLTDEAPKRHRLIYVERHAATRSLTNAHDVSRVFADHGWETLDPGSLTLDEQIARFREARAVAGVHGAALTNLLWCTPGTQVVEFMPSRRRNGCYAGISLVAGLNHRTLVAASNREGAMAVSIPTLTAKLSEIHRALATDG